MKIALTYDLRTDYLAMGYDEEQAAEFDSDETIDALETTIASLGHQVERIGHARALCARLCAGDRWDLAFNIAEGMAGRCREAQVPAILELFNIPYTFSDPLVCAATLDKGVAKRLVAAHGIRTPRFHVVRCPMDVDDVALTYPLFAKPLAEGTGKGIDAHSRIDNVRQLRKTCNDLLDRFAQPVLVEEFLPGREFTVGILGNGSDARVIGVMEVELLKKADRDLIYSLDVKEHWESHIRYTTLAAGLLRHEVEELALACYRALECRDAARVDVRLDPAGRPAFMEVNPLPGLHPTHSDLPILATREGVSYPELIGGVIDAALSRLGVSPCTVAKPS